MSGLSVAAEELIKIYRSRRVRYRALCGVSLELAPGEFAVVTGTSGSGKSTLLNLLAGLEPPTSGVIRIGDQRIDRMSEDRLAVFRLKHTGFVFQNFNLLPDLTVLENTALPLMIGGMGRKEREERATSLLARLGLKAHLTHLPSELSGGQQQRTAIARALVTEPQVLFADEPTGNLDSRTADEVMDLLIREVRERDMTLLMVTHDDKRAARADRIIEIRDGKVENDFAGGTDERI